jgi:hypothetical protein
MAVAVPRDIPKDFRKVARKAGRQGWRFRKIKSGYQLLAPDGVHAVTIHKTPSHRSIENYKADMRKYGFKD